MWDEESGFAISAGLLCQMHGSRSTVPIITVESNYDTIVLLPHLIIFCKGGRNRRSLGSATRKVFRVWNVLVLGPEEDDSMTRPRRKSSRSKWTEQRISRKHIRIFSYRISVSYRAGFLTTWLPHVLVPNGGIRRKPTGYQQGRNYTSSKWLPDCSSDGSVRLWVQRSAQTVSFTYCKYKQ